MMNEPQERTKNVHTYTRENTKRSLLLDVKSKAARDKPCFSDINPGPKVFS